MDGPFPTRDFSALCQESWNRRYNELNPNEIHHLVHPLSMRERIIATNGDAAHHVVWITPLGGGPPGADSRAAIGTWLSAMAADTSGATTDVKAGRHRPPEATDACWTDDRTRIDEPFDDRGGRCAEMFPSHSLPRIVSGGPVANDVLKCTPKAPARADYQVTPTTGQCQRLEAAFPDGVCDWSAPGVEQAPLAATWISYGDGGLVPDQPDPPDPPDPDDHDVAYVDELYRDFLGRPADPGGSDYWAGRLAAGTPRSTVASGIVRSGESYRAMVDDANQRLLDRRVDTDGRAHFTGVVAEEGIEAVERALLRSDEYQRQAGDTLVDALYQDVLGRPADPAGRDHWNDELDAGLSVDGLVRALMGSDEGVRRQVRLAYERYLDRPADDGGLAYWAGQLRAGLSRIDMWTRMAASAEYVSRV